MLLRLEHGILLDKAAVSFFLHFPISIGGHLCFNNRKCYKNIHKNKSKTHTKTMSFLPGTIMQRIWLMVLVTYDLWSWLVEDNLARKHVLSGNSYFFRLWILFTLAVLSDDICSIHRRVWIFMNKYHIAAGNEGDGLISSTKHRFSSCIIKI